MVIQVSNDSLQKNTKYRAVSLGTCSQSCSETIGKIDNRLNKVSAVVFIA